jgi:hypothetical protein
MTDCHPAHSAQRAVRRGLIPKRRRNRFLNIPTAPSAFLKLLALDGLNTM